MKESIEQKLRRLAKESEQEMRDMGFTSQMKHYISYNISPKATRRLGVCKNKRAIEISRYVLEVGTDKQIKNVIIHEIIHTFDDCVGHKARWQMYARMVNNYGVYHITTTENIEKFMKENGTNEERMHELCNHRYKITCLKCGAVYYKSRMQNNTLYGYAHGYRRHTNCGGNHFEVVDTKKDEVLVNGVEI